jgi:hypothetical protein
MFSYPPTLPICAGDNLVLDGQGFASAMNSGAGVGTREEKREFLLAEILWLDFPRFDGNGDPLQWIHCCECYFRDCRTPENKRIAYAAFHLTAPNCGIIGFLTAHPRGSNLCFSSLLASDRRSRSTVVAVRATSRALATIWSQAVVCYSWAATAATRKPGSAHMTWTRETQRLAMVGAIALLWMVAMAATAASCWMRASA